MIVNEIKIYSEKLLSQNVLETLSDLKIPNNEPIREWTVQQA